MIAAIICCMDFIRLKEILLQLKQCLAKSQCLHLASVKIETFLDDLHITQKQRKINIYQKKIEKNKEVQSMKKAQDTHKQVDQIYMFQFEFAQKHF